MSDLKLVIANKNYSSWSLRPWLVMRHFRMPFEEIIIQLDQPTTAAEIARYSPAGRVPVLIDGDLHIWESLAILEYLADRHPGLWPSDPAAKALARSISAEMHAGFTALRDELPMNVRATGRKVTPSTATAADIARIRAIWHDCLKRSGGPWLFGEFTIADAMFAPVALRFHTYGLACDEQSVRFLGCVREHPSVKDWIAAAGDESWSIPHEEVGV